MLDGCEHVLQALMQAPWLENKPAPIMYAQDSWQLFAFASAWEETMEVRPTKKSAPMAAVKMNFFI